MSVEEERKYDGAYLDTHLFTAPHLDLAPPGGVTGTSY
jgi:hypothetical protein